ncbi:hypothetical protein F0U62_17335 [Cystobacter fuscus]|uniref:hypothetical protein n=1 Tax=Cystobacter fuscus TaxID=43 RepID=UPI002B2DE50C|nr:hypothetical protein F0U62_17335 [Cystobacter fuscus]
MRYHVRTPDGELDYLSFREVELAYMQGLVGPDDEVREEGQTLWRKASKIPELARARPASLQGNAARIRFGAVISAVVLGLFSLRLIFSESWTRRGIGIALALVTSAILTQLTRQAFKRPGVP